MRKKHDQILCISEVCAMFQSLFRPGAKFMTEHCKYLKERTNCAGLENPYKRHPWDCKTMSFVICTTLI